MKQICYILYGLWVVLAVVLKILGLVSWGVATSWAWMPFAMLLTFLVGVNLVVAIGQRLKRKEESKIPDSCDVCLFAQTAKYAENGKCLGCTMDENHQFGTLCPAYKRHIAKN